MGLMEMLSGGGQRRGEYEDFVKRYEQGPPHEGYDDDEVLRRYDEVSSELSDDDYELSAEEAFQRMSPQERRQLAQMVRQQGRQRNLDLGEFDQDDDERLEDPRHLARMTRKVRKQQPGGLGGLLGGLGGGGGGGGGGAGMLGNPMAKAALAGVAAMAAKRMFGK
jgi:hypothetical protein